MPCTNAQHKEWRDKNRDHLNESKRNRYAKNPESILDKNAKWKRENPEKLKILNRNHHYKKRYGITIEDYELILKSQLHKCKICGTTETGRKGSIHFAVDHCHETGQIRGLLCHHCNTGLGKFKDNVELLKKAITYLEE